MTACGGGARMTAAAAAEKMAAPWVLACSLLLLCLAAFQGAEGAIGVNYGMIANNLPAPEQVISMYKAKNINYVRLFHPDTSVLNALRGSGIGVVLGTLNEDLPRLASDPSFAASWVATNVQPFAGAVQFRYINAGNEVIPGDTAAQVLPAMQNLESALRSAGVTGVPVTTAVATSVLGTSNPPSQGAFSEAAAPVMAPIVSYLSSRGAPLLVNVYPYFAYSGSGGQVVLGYALLSADAGGAASSVTDGGVVYTNMFDAIVDATHAAVEKAGVQGLELVVSETGWPSGGGGDGATVENAAAYNNNVVRHVGGGTPRLPGKDVETYLFAMFNENGKAEGVEQHFGLFQPDMSEVYHVDFTAGSSEASGVALVCPGLQCMSVHRVTPHPMDLFSTSLSSLLITVVIYSSTPSVCHASLLDHFDLCSAAFFCVLHGAASFFYNDSTTASVRLDASPH
ncbi:putative glucan endo-1,3-beta-glucosidase GVI [Miscanthus floridulus]|uniref:putative glucan endo-1,3-beta-glucosidase GVI n=1 Tax=Miscanthus floridulus TaxID=154761 RepID=UPI003458DCC9